MYEKPTCMEYDPERKILVATEDILIPVVKEKEPPPTKGFRLTRMQAVTNYESNFEQLYRAVDEKEYVDDLMTALAPRYEQAHCPKRYDKEVQTDLTLCELDNDSIEQELGNVIFEGSDEMEFKDIYNSDDDEYYSVSSENVKEYINIEDAKKMMRKKNFGVRSDARTGDILLVFYDDKGENELIPIGRGHVKDVYVEVKPKWAEEAEVTIEDSLETLHDTSPRYDRRPKKRRYRRLKENPILKFLDYDFADDLESSSSSLEESRKKIDGSNESIVEIESDKQGSKKKSKLKKLSFTDVTAAEINEKNLRRSHKAALKALKEDKKMANAIPESTDGEFSAKTSHKNGTDTPDTKATAEAESFIQKSKTKSGPSGKDEPESSDGELVTGRPELIIDEDKTDESATVEGEFAEKRRTELEPPGEGKLEQRDAESPKGKSEIMAPRSGMDKKPIAIVKPSARKSKLESEPSEVVKSKLKTIDESVNQLDAIPTSDAEYSSEKGKTDFEPFEVVESILRGMDEISSDDNGTSKTLTTETDKVPSTETDKVPSTETDKVALTVPLTKTDKVASTVPSTETDKAPSTVPSTKTDKVPSTVPSTKTDKVASTVPLTKTDKVASTVPSTKTDKVPSTVPSTKTDKAPSTVPLTKTDKVASTVPSTKTDKLPSTVPLTKTDKVPSTVPSTKTDKVPSTETDKVPSSETKYSEKSKTKLVQPERSKSKLRGIGELSRDKPRVESGEKTKPEPKTFVEMVSNDRKMADNVEEIAANGGKKLIHQRYPGFFGKGKDSTEPSSPKLAKREEPTQQLESRTAQVVTDSKRDVPSRENDALDLTRKSSVMETLQRVEEEMKPLKAQLAKIQREMLEIDENYQLKDQRIPARGTESKDHTFYPSSSRAFRRNLDEDRPMRSRSDGPLSSGGSKYSNLPSATELAEKIIYGNSPSQSSHSNPIWSEPEDVPSGSESDPETRTAKKEKKKEK